MGNGLEDLVTKHIPNAIYWTTEAALDIGDWFANDFVEFWEEDFVDFWTEDIPEVLLPAGLWLEQAAIDVYEGLEDAVEWISGGDNWEAAFTTLTSSVGLLY